VLPIPSGSCPRILWADLCLCCLSVLCCACAVYFDPTPVFVTLQPDTYHFVTKVLDEQLEEKKNLKWTHLIPAADFYTQFVRCVFDMCLYGNSETIHDGDVLRRNAFYNQNELELVPKLLKRFTPAPHHKRLLSNLVTCAHFSIQLLDELADSNHIVLGRKRKIAQRKKKAPAAGAGDGKDGKSGDGDDIDAAGKAGGKDGNERSTDDPDENDVKGDAAQVEGAAAKSTNEEGGEEAEQKAVYRRIESDFNFDKLLASYSHPVVCSRLARAPCVPLCVARPLIVVCPSVRMHRFCLI
jgi:hypothetical protein